MVNSNLTYFHDGGSHDDLGVHGGHHHCHGDEKTPRILGWTDSAANIII